MESCTNTVQEHSVLEFFKLEICTLSPLLNCSPYENSTKIILSLLDVS